MIMLTVAPPGKRSCVDRGSSANVLSICALVAKYDVGSGSGAPPARPAPAPRPDGRGVNTRTATYSKRAEGSIAYATSRGTYTTSPPLTEALAGVAPACSVTLAVPFRTNQYSSAS